jgi:tryptophanyl-tRNA synthetase
MYGEPDRPLVVPVGEDQVAHVELNREIVRRFNFDFGGLEVYPSIMNEENFNRLAQFESFLASHGEVENVLPLSGEENTSVPQTLEKAATRVARQIGYENCLEELGSARIFVSARAILSEPEVMLTEAKRVPGTDGRKMSKSYGNAIELGESDESIRAKTKAMMTDPARKRRTDPGDPEKCPAYDWHKLFSPPETLKWAADGCRSAGIGCIECKAAMTDHLIKWIAPIRERRAEYSAHPENVLRLLDEGSKRAQVTASATMKRVREAVFGWEGKRSSISAGGSAATGKRSGAGD